MPERTDDASCRIPADRTFNVFRWARSEPGYSVPARRSVLEQQLLQYRPEFSAAIYGAGTERAAQQTSRRSMGAMSAILSGIVLTRSGSNAYAWDGVGVLSRTARLTADYIFQRNPHLVQIQFAPRSAASICKGQGVLLVACVARNAGEVVSITSAPTLAERGPLAPGCGASLRYVVLSRPDMCLFLPRAGIQRQAASMQRQPCRRHGGHQEPAVYRIRTREARFRSLTRCITRAGQCGKFAVRTTAATAGRRGRT